jgi:putative ABC transport system permease protein
MSAFLRELTWDLRGNRVNAFLSFLALCVATLSFVLISVLAHVGTDALVARSEQLDGRAVTLQAGLPTDGWSRQRVDAISSGLRNSSWMGTQGSLVLDRTAWLTTDGPQPERVTLRLTSSDYRSIRRIPVTQGRWFTDSAYPGEATVNAAADRLLVKSGSAALDLGYRPGLDLTVVGVVADANPQPMIYASVQGMQSSAPLMAPDQAGLLLHTDAARAADGPARVAELLSRAGMHVTPEVTRADQAAQIASSFSTLTKVFLLVALIGLIVAVIGMINVGIASVRERARDFTIRRAMGATRLRIIAGVAASTALIGIAATSVAILLSYALTTVLTPYLVDSTSGISRPDYPWTTAVAAAAAGILASLISGLAPALRTRSLDLAALLRE